MIIVKSQRATDSGSSSGARDDAGGSSGSPRDTSSLPENLFGGGGEPETEDSRSKKKNRKFKGKRIYQLGITVPEVDDEDAMPRRSA